ncbi:MULTISPECIES: cysteine hydrolase family protein [unclassified Pseudomonas]|uniref:cysteine hydrolase family protein n=1 Tax=unclassified Pseudomonas TaxID=196821 RepID=UPI0024499E6F|nr:MULTISPECIES: cysteine hydrolase family protein [unclassified Pseudomonas]MDG9931253.1 cysteine hydrolase [Pseudomonas sp. GD04042]MDH0484886.1 cysteine hydrolase [Pseudomonas sp. GD04015]MDH0606954.1 cysteine hydrolase [Pseudomonas sp. GD03869]
MNQPPKRALIVIDVQNEYVTGNLRIEHPPIDHSLANVGRAMDAASAAGIPVIVVQHLAPEGSPIFARDSQAAELHPQVAQRPRDHFIQKEMASCFAGTDLADYLKQRGIDTLSVVGYMIHHCDDSTVRQAHHEGWQVELLHDATGAPPYRNAMGSATAEEIHRVFTVVMHTGFAAVLGTDDWIEALHSGEAPQPDNIYLSNQRAIANR